MYPLLLFKITNLILTLVWVHHGNGLAIDATVDSGNVTAGLDIRQALEIEVQPCLTSGAITAAKGSMVAAAKEVDLESAPWLPNCLNIPKGSGRTKCLECFAVAAGVYGTAVAGCTAVSTACLLVSPECEAVCVAIASYSLWTAEQACYCEHADCSDSATRNSGNIKGAPELTIGGGHFSVSPQLNQGYDVDFKFVYPPRGANANCYNRGCNAADGCRSGN